MPLVPIKEKKEEEQEQVLEKAIDKEVKIEENKTLVKKKKNYKK